MKKFTLFKISRRQLVSIILIIFFTCTLNSIVAAENEEDTSDIHDVINVQKYNRSIHIMAMLLVGFGFLMVFVRGYGRSALTMTFILVSIAIPLYMFIVNLGFFNGQTSEIDKFILSEFAAAGLLIAAGATLGRLKMPQYLLLGAMFIPFYILNEWILLEGGFGILPVGAILDTGGSIVIHAFGAFFGLGVVIAITKNEDFKKAIKADYNSDRFSMLGSMILWIFWPSFCAALVTADQIPHTIINVFIALCGSTLATYITSTLLRGKTAISDIANAALAGGVAIGSTCVVSNSTSAFIIGCLAGLISTVSFILIHQHLQKRLGMIDTCGVMNLHGFPGILGGVSAIIVTSSISITYQLTGIVITIILAVSSGVLTGNILRLFKKRTKYYDDSEEFIDEE